MIYRLFVYSQISNFIFSPCQAPTMCLEEIINGITSNDTNKQVIATQSARKMLSRERNPPIDAIINAGMVTPLVAFLDRADKYG